MAKNLTGRTNREVHLFNRLGDLSVKAINKIGLVLDNGAPSEQLRAAELVLGYALGKPKQRAELSVNVTSPAAAHLAALTELTNLAAKADAAIAAKPLITLDNPSVSDKLTVNHSDIIDVEAVLVEDEKP